MRNASGECCSILRDPRDRLDLEVGERHDLVDETHVERGLRVVLLAEVPDLARLLLADDARQQTRTEATVERTDARTGLTEARVVGRDRQVAHDVQHVTAADRVARDHRDHGLRQAPDLDLQIEHVEPADALVVAVPVVAADALVAARAERVGALAGEHDDADFGIVTRDLERVAQLEQRARAGTRCAPRAGRS